MKSDRKRTQKEEDKEMEKQTRLNIGALKNSNCVDVDLAFDTNIAIEEFMTIVSTQRKHKKNHHAKTTTREKKKEKKKFNPFYDCECYYSARRRIKEWRCAKKYWQARRVKKKTKKQRNQWWRKCVRAGCTAQSNNFMMTKTMKAKTRTMIWKPWRNHLLLWTFK